MTAALSTIEVLPPQATEIISVVPSMQDALRDRESLDNETLGACIEEYVSGAFVKLARCLPLVEEMKRRFVNLHREKQVNGEYLTISGCRTFKEYCEKVLHRTERAVYYALQKGGPKKALPPDEPSQQDETAATFLPRLEAVFGKDNVKVALSGERFRVTLLLDEKDLNTFLEKSSHPVLPPSRRLSAEDRRSICEQVRRGTETQAAIAKRWGVTQATVSNVWRRGAA